LLLNKYLIFELIIPSCLSFLILITVLMLTKVLNIAELIFDKGVEFAVIFKIILSIILYLTGIALPLAFLFGIILCFGRLSSDNEIVALRTSGISMLKILSPILFSSICLFIFSLILNSSIIPRINWSADQDIRKLAQNPSSLLEEKEWMSGFGDGVSLYINNLSDKKDFKKIVILQPLPDKPVPRVIMAKSGMYNFDEKTKMITFTLFDGHIDEPQENDNKSFATIEFSQYEISIFTWRGKFSKASKKPNHYTYDELKRQLTIIPENRVDYKALLYEKHSRFSMAFAPIVFFLIGFPVSIRFQRSEKSANFMIGISLALCWYLIMLLGRGLSLSGYISIFIGSWIPNIIIGIIGLFLTIRVAKN